MAKTPETDRRTLTFPQEEKVARWLRKNKTKHRREQTPTEKARQQCEADVGFKVSQHQFYRMRRETNTDWYAGREPEPAALPAPPAVVVVAPPPAERPPVTPPGYKPGIDLSFLDHPNDRPSALKPAGPMPPLPAAAVAEVLKTVSLPISVPEPEPEADAADDEFDGGEDFIGDDDVLELDDIVPEEGPELTPQQVARRQSVLMVAKEAQRIAQVALDECRHEALCWASQRADLEGQVAELTERVTKLEVERAHLAGAIDRLLAGLLALADGMGGFIFPPVCGPEFNRRPPRVPKT